MAPLYMASTSFPVTSNRIGVHVCLTCLKINLILIAISSQVLRTFYSFPHYQKWQTSGPLADSGLWTCLVWCVVFLKIRITCQHLEFRRFLGEYASVQLLMKTWETWPRLACSPSWQQRPEPSHFCCVTRSHICLPP